MKLSPELDDIIIQQGNMRLYFDEGTSPLHKDSVVQVRFGANGADSFDEEHVIMLHPGFPAALETRPEMYLLFPNTRDPRRRILAAHTYWSLDSLNKDMNRALDDSPAHSSTGGGTRFALAYGSHVVGFGPLQGTLYLVWARSVTLYNASKTVVSITNDCPLLVNMNGEALVNGIYVPTVPPSRAPLPMVQRDDLRTPILLGDHAALWVWEKRPERGGSGALRVMAYKEAVNYATKPSRNTREWMTIETTANGLTEDEGVGGDDDASAPAPVMTPYDWRATPDGLFIADVPGGSLMLRHQGVVVSVAHSDGPEARDPFLEYE